MAVYLVLRDNLRREAASLPYRHFGDTAAPATAARSRRAFGDAMPTTGPRSLSVDMDGSAFVRRSTWSLHQGIRCSSRRRHPGSSRVDRWDDLLVCFQGLSGRIGSVRHDRVGRPVTSIGGCRAYRPRLLAFGAAA